ncbi:hypothetical protein [Thiorhodovibrio frisius]|uniref:ADP-heptose:LPS heptosyltransferase n=1 Tax=Thiorhodovibrio frisius TaxID=631362 RepID=H8Z4M9_9GAMM|nr:hypothetical protein [Thiorhodovibrio frisius]EIC20286.1 hypothetical protein Thi970DRAFT_03911 [Thiorhodovibrio frisius]WPL21023.1 hypothetical protein Thiofri_01130 [Thiorhodovibrio frisius]
MTPEAGPERILLVRLSAIGDIVFASPLINGMVEGKLARYRDLRNGG